jgi:hypothetical protein
LSDPGHPYCGGIAALLTQHGKEAVIAPPLRARLDIGLLRVEGYDTDRLGTFTRDVPRAGSQLEAARSKAQLAMQLSGLSWGMGSEGSFGPDPLLGLAAWNTELLVWTDGERGLEIIASAAGPETNYRQGWVGDWAEATAFAAAASFPSHALVVSAAPDAVPVAKGIGDEASLSRMVAQVLARQSRAWLETDMRAHANPTRMAMIARAAEDLAARLESLCPSCGAPGWWSVAPVPGRPCADCGQPTRLPVAQRWQCTLCGHEEIRLLPQESADPAECDHCNP